MKGCLNEVSNITIKNSANGISQDRYIAKYFCRKIQIIYMYIFLHKNDFISGTKRFLLSLSASAEVSVGHSMWEPVLSRYGNRHN